MASAVAAADKAAMKKAALLDAGHYKAVLDLDPNHPEALELKRQAELKQQNRVEFVFATDTDGKPLNLKSKLVTVGDFQKLYPKPDHARSNDGPPVGPFSIFHQLKTEAGANEENGFYRVGDSTGKPLGWLKKETVVQWNTRYVLEPIVNSGDGAFTLYNARRTLRAKDVFDGRLQLVRPPSVRRLRLGPILGPPTEDLGYDTQYPVIILDRIADQGNGGLSDIKDKFQDLTMEIVFVYEATDALLRTVKKGTSDETQMLKLLQNLMRSITAKLDEAGVSQLVRFGIVGFQDNTSHILTVYPAPFRARVIQPLTTDTDILSQAISRKPAYSIGGDWSEDGLSGISMALDMLDKDTHSSKHIIYFGCSSLHEHGKGQPHTMWGKPKRFSGNSVRAQLYVTDGNYTGYTQSGLTVRSIMDRARPTSSSSPLTSKTIHTIMSSAEMEDILGDIDKARREEYMRLAPSILQVADTAADSQEYLTKILSICPGDDTLAKILFGKSAMACWDYYQSRDLGFQQLQLLAKNTSNYPGYHGRADATKAQYEKVVNDLFIELTKIIPVLQAAKRGDPLAVEQLTNSGSVAEGAFTAGSFRTASQQILSEILDDITFLGDAPAWDEDGTRVANKCVLVGRSELAVFVNRLDAIITLFTDKADPNVRHDVKRLLSDSQQMSLELVTGEQLNVIPEAELRAMIAELPLRTGIMDMTPKSLSVMTGEEFEQWVGSFRRSRELCEALLDDASKWVTLTDTAPQDKFAFIRIEDLP